MIPSSVSGMSSDNWRPSGPKIAELPPPGRLIMGPLLVSMTSMPLCESTEVVWSTKDWDSMA
jgi:hypothetical protein